MKTCCIIILSFLFNLVTAQERIETIRVSVTGLDSVIIEWKPFSDISSINKYILYQYIYYPVPGADPSTAISISTNSTDLTFLYPDVQTQPVEFVIYAQPKVGNEDFAPLNISRTIYIYPPVYDSCASIINLQWTQYKGWGSKPNNFTGNVKEYQIFDATTKTIIASTTDTVYPISSIKQNKNYSFYIKAIQTNDNSITSQSNTKSVYTGSSTPPDFINAQTANYVNNKTVEILFELDPNSQMNDYHLTRSDSPTGTYTSINDYLNYTSSSLLASDPNPLTTTAYYRLEAINNCLQSTTISDTATAIVPKVTINGQIINITWDEYIKWPAGVSQYQIYHKTSGTDYTLYQTVLPSNSLLCTEDINSLIGQNIQGNICYYIKAISNGSIPYESISKSVCVDLTIQVFIPNAFTPDGNGQNDWFTASFAFIPNNFKMYIYDRYGYKIFETSDLKGWNGLLKNNKKAPEGAYIYFISFSTAVGEKIEKKGSFSLIYP